MTIRKKHDNFSYFLLDGHTFVPWATESALSLLI